VENLYEAVVAELRRRQEKREKEKAAKQPAEQIR